MQVANAKTERYCKAAERAHELVRDAFARYRRCQQASVEAAYAGGSMDDIAAVFHEACAEVLAARLIAIAAWNAREEIPTREQIGRLVRLAAAEDQLRAELEDCFEQSRSSSGPSLLKQ
jgi:hypothetical protein